MTINWPLTDWNEPDLDCGVIEHKTLTDEQLTATLSKSDIKRIFRAADVFAAEADEQNIDVTADEWLLQGKMVCDHDWIEDCGFWYCRHCGVPK